MQLRAAPFLWAPWRELWDLLLGFLQGWDSAICRQLSYSINPGATAELTHSAVSAFRQAQIIHRPVDVIVTDGSLWVMKAKFSAEAIQDNVTGKPVELQLCRAGSPAYPKSLSNSCVLTTTHLNCMRILQPLPAFSTLFPLLLFLFFSPSVLFLCLFLVFSIRHVSSPHILLHVMHWPPHFLNQISMTDLRDVSTFKLYCYKRDGSKR